MAEFEFKISIASKLDQVWQVRVAVAAILEELEVSDIDRLHVQLAVAEAINNCIEHGYSEAGGGRIDLTAEVREDGLTIEIYDDAPPLPIANLEHLLNEPVAEPSENVPLLSGGRGLQIMRSTMDSVVFSRHENRNKLTLSKALKRICDCPDVPS